MNLHVKITKNSNMETFVNKASSIIIPTIFSLRSNQYFTLDEIILFCEKNKQQKFYLEINKIFHEFDMESVFEFIDEISKLENIGIIYQDLGILNYVISNKLNIDLVYDPQTYLTSSKQMNFYEQFNVRNFVLSRELTLQEIKKILPNVNNKLNVWMQGFGYTQMLHSKRNLVQNYQDFELKTFNNKLTLDYDKLSLFDEERQLSYPLISKADETFIMSALPINVIEEMLKLDKYGLKNIFLDFTLIENNIQEFVFDTYFEACEMLKLQTLTKDDLINFKQKIDLSTKNGTNLGLLYKKTMYKI